MKLTNSTDEAPISSLLSGDLVFGIPLFQRRYKWKKENIERFQDDLTNLVEIDDTSHFLGAIIVFSKATKPSEPNYYEVIDGQQRLTTCYLSLLALCKTFASHGFYDDAIALYQRYLVIIRNTSQITNAKLICCKEDRAGFNAVFHDLNSVSTFYQQIQKKDCEYRNMPNTGSIQGKVLENYRSFCKFYEKKYSDSEKALPGEGYNTLLNFFSKLVDSMSVVQIVVKNPTDGPKIFNSLNSKQEPITIGDLVRNELFARLAGREEERIIELDSKYWQPFYEKFKDNGKENGDKIFEQYFFPYVLTLDHTVKKLEAFNYLRDKWARENNDPIKIIGELERYQDVYLDLCCGSRLSSSPEVIKKIINCFYRMGAPSSIYPFIMKVVDAVNESLLEIPVAVQILQIVESFLTRRVVCGYEPTGLHAVFKQLWNDCQNSGGLNASIVEEMIRRHTTVPWPNNEEFTKAIKERPLYKVKITPYLLEEWNNHLPGDTPSLSAVQIEHVLPESPKVDSQWNIDWPKEDQKMYRDCLANLLPLSQSLNGSLQNDDYDQKRSRYKSESALKAPRHFAETYDKWTPTEFADRSKKLADWALSRWKF